MNQLVVQQSHGFNVVCPKPRRLGQLIASNPMRPVRSMHMSHLIDLCDSTSCGDVWDVILTEDRHDDVDYQWEDSIVSCSPPFFCGSPPTRAPNPLIQDARFLEEKTNNNPYSPPSFISPTSPSSGGRKTGGFFRSSNFGPKPAMVRIEGFECLNQDRHGCGISAFA